MSNETNQAQTQVQKAFAQLNINIDRLAELVKTQEQKLASVLKEQPQEAENACELQEREVPLAEILNFYNRKLSDIIYKVSSMLSRLEL